MSASLSPLLFGETDADKSNKLTLGSCMVNYDLPTKRYVFSGRVFRWEKIFLVHIINGLYDTPD